MIQVWVCPLVVLPPSDGVFDEDRTCRQVSLELVWRCHICRPLLLEGRKIVERVGTHLMMYLSISATVDGQLIEYTYWDWLVCCMGCSSDLARLPPWAERDVLILLLELVLRHEFNVCDPICWPVRVDKILGLVSWVKD